MSQPLLPGGHRPSMRELAASILRVLVAMTVVLLLYAVVPVRVESGWGDIILLLLSLVVFALVLAWQVRATITSHRPVQRGLEALAVTAPLFLCLFALQYMGQDQLNPGSFSEPLDRFSALYYTVVTFGTVGFGDITPKTVTTRTITMIQIIADLIFIGVGVKLIASAAKTGVQRKAAQAS